MGKKRKKTRASKSKKSWKRNGQDQVFHKPKEHIIINQAKLALEIHRNQF